MHTLYLIDAMALAFRVFYALGRSKPLTTSSGTKVSVPYGAAVFLHKLITEFNPDYLALVCDTEAKTFRHELYADYKANRGDMPADLAEQLPLFFELFACFDIELIKVPGYEADDIIGTLAKQASAAQLHTYIVSNDKDFMQLIAAHVAMLNKDYQVLREEAVQQKFQCRPQQVIDCLALIGDSADNVPGVRGIGAKGAAKLIAEFGSLAAIYRHIDAVKPEGLRQKLSAGREQAELSRRLVTIDTAVPLPTQISKLTYNADIFNNQRLYNFYQQLEFKRLLPNFTCHQQSTVQRQHTLAVHRPPTLAELESGKELAELESKAAVGNARLLARSSHSGKGLAELEQQLPRLQSLPQLLVMVQADSIDLVTAKPTQLVLGDAQELCVVDMARLGLAGITELLSPLLQAEATLKLGYNLKSVWRVLNNVNISLAGELADVLLYDYLLNPDWHNHSLVSISERYLDKQVDMGDMVAQAEAVMQLVDKLTTEVAAQGMGKLAAEMEMPLSRVLAKMEARGIFVDGDVLHDYGKSLQRDLRVLEEKIYAAAPRKFNINSPQQLQQILFVELKIHEQLNIKSIRRTKTGYSTNETVLNLLRAHPLPRLMLEYRGLSKLKNTYVDALPRHVHERTRRLHTNLRQDVAATGRLSSDNPNLQNIPMRSERGQLLRKAFTVQDKDSVLISADYSQIELRLLASLAQAKSLITAFNAGHDIHRQTAAQVFVIAPERVSKDQRAVAKAINFGIVYGMGARKFSKTVGVSMAEAQEFINRYFAAYPEIKKFTESLIQLAAKRGYSQTPCGRRRTIAGLDEVNAQVYAHARNMAVNSCIQGYAADLIKLAMLKVDAALHAAQLRAMMLLQIHDELLFECPRAELGQATEIIKDSMENALQGAVRFQVNIKHGNNWLDAE